MKFSKDTVNILKSFAGLHSNLMLNKGNILLTKNESGTVFAEATITDDIDVTVGIYDLKQVLTFISMLDNPELTLAGSQLKVFDSKGRSAKFNAADPSVITFPAKRLNFPVADVTFDISYATMDQVRNGGAVLGLKTFTIFNRDSKIWVKACSVENDTNDTFEAPVCDYDGTATFEIHIDMADLRLIEADHYHVLISKLGASRFEGRVIDKQGVVVPTGINYIVSNGHTSKFSA